MRPGGAGGDRDRRMPGAADEPMEFRIGVNVGDVMVDGDNLLGDGVNIAARLEALRARRDLRLGHSARSHRQQVPAGLQRSRRSAGQKYRSGDPSLSGLSWKCQGSTRRHSAAARKPSIAVLPFPNMSGDPEQEFFADGMAEDMITAYLATPRCS